MPGILDMPTASALPDGEFATTLGHFNGNTRITLAFQMAPRLTGSFRYAAIADLDDTGLGGALFDRSFDLHWSVWDESGWRPALAIGLRDIVGTGVYSSEYIVVSKTFAERFRGTIGLGWGRLAGRGSFGNPIGRWAIRPDVDLGSGGTFAANQWFRGDMAVFGGLEYQATERLSLQVEYSPDLYVRERDGTFSLNSPFNFALTYRFNKTASVQAAYMYGNSLGVSLNLAFNPKRGPFGSGTERAPPAVVARPDRQNRPDLWTPVWADVAEFRAKIEADVAELLEKQDLTLVGFEISAQHVRVSFRNDRYRQTAQAIGRVARVLSARMPASVQTFEILPLADDVSTSVIKMDRSDIEHLEYAFDGTDGMRRAADISDAGQVDMPRPIAGAYPRFTWRLAPYNRVSLFDPSNPLIYDVGIQLSGTYRLAPGLSVYGAVRQKLTGNLNKSRLVRPYPQGAPPIVRSDSYEFNQFSDLTIERLTANYLFRPGENLYGRISVGLLERMYGGVSTELLWKVPGRRWALGVDVNHVKKRAYEQNLDLQDYEVTTGHLSAYFDLPKGYQFQVDAGRFLAADIGARFTVAREFRNGWRIGAFATLTNVGFEEFGEGSFDKGVILSVPLDWLRGKPTRRNVVRTLRPILRDGGARLNVRNRLYPLVRGRSDPKLTEGWGRFWQ